MAPMTPLNEDLTERRARIPTGRTPRRRGPIGLTRPPAQPDRPARLEIWQAVSVDGRWLYERTETDTTPWVVTYLPTGQETTFGTLPDSRRWTASDQALPMLRARAHDIISRDGYTSTAVLTLGSGGWLQRTEPNAKEAAIRLALAMRAAAVLDGALVSETETARCQQAGPLAVCGGYLAETTTGWVHVDTCRECVGLTVKEKRNCHNLAGHLACGQPEPVPCEHPRCDEPAGLVQLCPRDRDRCCDSCCIVVCGAQAWGER